MPTVRCTVTDEEWEWIHNYCTPMGLTVSAFMKYSTFARIRDAEAKSKNRRRKDEITVPHTDGAVEAQKRADTLRTRSQGRVLNISGEAKAR